MSRKNENSPTRPPEISSTCSAHATYPSPFSSGLYCANAGEPLTVPTGTSREPRHPWPGPNHQREDVGASAQPEIERRHRLRRVLVDQRGQRVDVVTLERGDVALEQLAVDLLDRIGRGHVVRLDRRARALQGAVHRGDGCLEQLGDLARLPAQHLREDQRGALPGRQVLQRGDERQAHRLALDRRVLGQVRVRDRLQPHDFGGHVQVLDHRRAGRAEVHRPRAPLAPAQHVETDVRRDPVEPRPQRRASLEPVVPRARRAPSSPAPRPRPRTARRACGSSRRSAPCGTARAPCRHRPGSPSPPMLLIRARWLDASRRRNSSHRSLDQLAAPLDEAARPATRRAAARAGRAGRPP